MALLFICILGGLFYFQTSPATFIASLQETTTPIYQAEYTGTATDSDLSDPIILSDFHSSLYRYEFINIKTTIIGENMTLQGDVVITMRAKPYSKFKGKVTASGLAVGGKAALSYKVSVNSNKETWIGALMVELPSSGDSRGYWLTSHNDFDAKSSGKYSLGDIYLTRNQNDISLDSQEGDTTN